MSSQVALADIVTYDPTDPTHTAAFTRCVLDEWIRPMFGSEPTDDAVFADPVAAFLLPGGALFLAQVCTEIVGAMGVLNHGAQGYELSKGGILRAYRGQGIGRLLAETALTWVQAQGAPNVWLETNTCLVPALQLYRSLGFVAAPFPGGSSARYRRADVFMRKTF